MDDLVDRLAFVAYETPFAPCGGIAAVMGRLPGRAQGVSGRAVAVLTPYHFRVEKTASLQLETVGAVEVGMDGYPVPVEVRRLVDERCAWYFLAAGQLEGVTEQEQLFAGRRHPYDMPLGQLVRDALFFGMAAAKALEVIDGDGAWALLLQDWQAATASLALSSLGLPHRAFLTLHNSYDSGGLGDGDLERVGLEPARCYGGSSLATVLERALRLVQWSVTTVSEQFADDFLDEPLQAEVMAPQLRESLRPRLHGVDNGLFVDLAVDEKAYHKALAGDFALLKKWKEARRAEFLQAISGLQDAPDEPVWGDPTGLGRTNAEEEMPWFIMAGRDDPRQKGYDVAVSAVRAFLRQGGRGCFLFFPIPGDEGLAGLKFLADLTFEFPDRVLALPFRFVEGFLGALRGAAFGIMPSLYEPFGMANEFYLNGTVGIGRATGGIVQQIVPLRSAAAFGRSVGLRAGRWHSASAHPTGILYREKDGIASLIADWHGINAGGYDAAGFRPDRVEARSGYALFGAMADELRYALADGVRLYEEMPELYYRMLVEGILYVRRAFSWERAAMEYVRIAT